MEQLEQQIPLQWELKKSAEVLGVVILHHQGEKEINLPPHHLLGESKLSNEDSSEIGMAYLDFSFPRERVALLSCGLSKGDFLCLLWML